MSACLFSLHLLLGSQIYIFLKMVSDLVAPLYLEYKVSTGGEKCLLEFEDVCVDPVGHAGRQAFSAENAFSVYLFLFLISLGIVF